MQNTSLLPSQFELLDHLGGFRQDASNQLFDVLSTQSRRFDITWHQIIDETVQARYPLLNLTFLPELQYKQNLRHFREYRQHPILSFKNFVCSFNGSAHMSRKMLVAILHKMNWFNPITCSKNVQFSTAVLDGHLADYLDADRHRYYRPFFMGDDSAQFFDRIYSFGHVRYDHARNIYNLERQLTGSFLHVISETMATSYYPFVTEKFLYSVITRGLFLAYAQPGWHEHVERYYGFRRYTKLFDYRFDTIQNPVQRLVELMSMISKFSFLSSDDWRDLYEMESETVEYNYDHYFSGRYLETLQQIE